MSAAIDFLPLLGGYLAGSISFAVLLSKMLGFPDPRSVGSGNPGATNVARGAGKKVAFLTLCLDVAKTSIPMWIAAVSGYGHPLVLLTGFAAFMGHLYPLYHGFKGGKGVASFTGFLLYANPLAALVWAVAWLVVVLPSRFVALGGVLAPLAVIALLWDSASLLMMVLLTAMTVLVAWRHTGNIRRIFQGTEPRMFS